MKTFSHSTNRTFLFKALACMLEIFGLLPSCKLRDANVNPTATTTAPNSAILSGSQLSLAFAISSGLNPIVGIFTQQYAGNQDAALSYQNYLEGSSHYNQYWNDVYPAALNNLSLLRQQSKGKSPYYAGIARVLLAYGFGATTDAFGDIPYTEALQGSSIQQPKYDSQEFVYQQIQLLLDSALLDFAQTSDPSRVINPASDDLIFGGNIAKWKAVANTLKARHALHLVKINPTAAQTALDFASKGIADNSGDLQLNFTAAVSNPLYQIQTFRKNWIALGRPLVNLLNGNTISDENTKEATLPIDPRRAAFATAASNGKYTGLQAGKTVPLSFVGAYYASPTSPVVLTSFTENKFIEAEARLRLGHTTSEVQTALNQAINASILKIAPTTADSIRTKYIAAKATLTGTFETDLELIITQKYIALFTQAEVWTDYRRTGYPTLAIWPGGNHSGNPGGAIPRRAPYPLIEQQLNPNIPTQSSDHQQPKLWWDK